MSLFIYLQLLNFHIFADASVLFCTTAEGTKEERVGKV